MKFLIVRKNRPKDKVSRKNINYKGMNREKFGSYTDVPDELLSRGLTIEDLPTDQAEIAYQTLLEDLLSLGITEYELLRLGGVFSDVWEFLGYDVGEITPTAWSAIRNQQDFLSEQEIAQWQDKLNSNGLFQELRDAEAFLACYIKSDDPDMGWTADGWTDNPGWYKAIPVYRYRKNP